MTTTYTDHFKFAIPDFTTTPWHAAFAALVQQIDRTLYDMAVLEGTQTWANSTAYNIGNVVISPEDGSMWVASVQHTSVASPTTFSADRAANPTYWDDVNLLILELADKASKTTEDQVLTGGARVTSKSLGTVAAGTITLDPGDRPLQHYINGGAHTLAPGANTGAMLVDITNNGSAGAITTTGWTKVSGDTFTTVNGHKFRCHASIGNGGSLLIVQAMQ